ncbi:MAG: hypothetical protein HC849_01910 [Oscillatoriales cyanobacterium RU_3_3]|nr:hypothetical protein [Microcoleus sp. SU_5_6]NJM59230.1 hypothetical protein [Oscillatoriales cyanobacterium RU_3_3]NJR20983.1 hypothetical protein [Richelia sp. CSU_2_1]
MHVTLKFHTVGSEDFSPVSLSEYNQPHCNYSHSPVSEVQAQSITNYQLPITNYQLPITNVKVLDNYINIPAPAWRVGAGINYCQI